MNTKTEYTTKYSNYDELTIEDFNTYFPNKNRISNYANEDKVKSQKAKEMNYKNMTLEELREKKKLVSNTNGRPSDSLTDKKWQEEFEIRKLFVTSNRISNKNSKLKRFGGMYSKEYGDWSENINGEYKGVTNWQSYCSFINDVLDNIRHGQIDYVYFIYQILDLLKFHFDDLRTKYHEDGQYWEVWLEKYID